VDKLLSSGDLVLEGVDLVISDIDEDSESLLSKDLELLAELGLIFTRGIGNLTLNIVDGRVELSKSVGGTS
jgi:hypothetical protein